MYRGKKHTQNITEDMDHEINIHIKGNDLADHHAKEARDQYPSNKVDTPDENEHTMMTHTTAIVAVLIGKISQIWLEQCPKKDFARAPKATPKPKDTLVDTACDSPKTPIQTKASAQAPIG